MELQAILDAMTANPELVKGILPVVVDTQVGKDLIANRADAIYKSKIDDEVKAIHTRYDDDIFSILGVRPGQKDGAKQKTYDFIKDLLTEFKGLKDIKDTLSKDAKVIELQGQVDKLKAEGGGKHIQEIFDKAKEDWATEKTALQQQIDDGQESSINFQKQTDIASAISKIKFDPEVSESIRKMVIESAETQLKANSKIEDGKLVYLDKDGKPLLDQTTYKPIDAMGVLSSMDAIKDISLIDGDKGKGGGGADTKIVGSIQTTTVEGKDTKKLNLPVGSITSKSQFLEVAEKALLESGVSRRDPDWDTLKNAAYAEHKVADLPATV